MLWFPFILLAVFSITLFLMALEIVGDPPDFLSEVVVVVGFCVYAAATICVGLAMWG